MRSSYLKHWQPNIPILIRNRRNKHTGSNYHHTHQLRQQSEHHQAVSKFSYQIIRRFPSSWEVKEVKSGTQDTVLWEETGQVSNTPMKFSLISELFPNFYLQHTHLPLQHKHEEGPFFKGRNSNKSQHLLTFTLVNTALCGLRKQQNNSITNNLVMKAGYLKAITI